MRWAFTFIKSSLHSKVFMTWMAYFLSYIVATASWSDNATDYELFCCTVAPFGVHSKPPLHRYDSQLAYNLAPEISFPSHTCIQERIQVVSIIISKVIEYPVSVKY